MTLPVFELLISEDENSDLEVGAVALVDLPAIQKNFLAFNEQTQVFSILDEERFIISGPAMLADVPIYRRDDDGTEYNVVFRADTIYKIAQKFFEKNFQSNFNIMHDSNQPAEGVTVFESFIVDSKRGIMPMKGFEDAADGSWFISAKVNNPDVWAGIKEGKFKGFSVEGNFKYKKDNFRLTEEEGWEQIKKILNAIS